MGYTTLVSENVPEVLKNKPRWMACAIIMVTTLAITTSAVAAGAFVGYTYCYLEHRHNMATGNITHPTNLQLLHGPLLQEKPKKNITINTAISGIFVSKLTGLRNSLLVHNDDVQPVTWAIDVPIELNSGL